MKDKDMREQAQSGAEEQRKKRVPRHPIISFLMPYLGPVREPETFEEQLLELVDSRLMFDGVSSFEDGVYTVKITLLEFEIEPLSEEGQFLVQSYIDHLLADDYGDFNHWSYCDNCGKEFQPTFSLEYANLVLKQERASCSECAVKARDENEAQL